MNSNLGIRELGIGSVIFWGRAPLDSPTADFEWRYVACHNAETGHQLYREMKNKLQPGWQLNIINTNDESAPLLPTTVENSILEQLHNSLMCGACGKMKSPIC